MQGLLMCGGTWTSWLRLLIGPVSGSGSLGHFRIGSWRGFGLICDGGVDLWWWGRWNWFVWESDFLVYERERERESMGLMGLEKKKREWSPCVCVRVVVFG